MRSPTSASTARWSGTYQGRDDHGDLDRHGLPVDGHRGRGAGPGRRHVVHPRRQHRRAPAGHRARRPHHQPGLVPQRRHDGRVCPEGLSGGPGPRDHPGARAGRPRARPTHDLAVHAGLNVTDDAFYAESPEWTEQMSGLGLLNVEMESSAMFVVARQRGLRAGDDLRRIEQSRGRARASTTTRPTSASRRAGARASRPRSTTAVELAPLAPRGPEPPHPPRGLGPAGDSRRSRPLDGRPRPGRRLGATPCGCEAPADLTVFLAHVAAAYPVLGSPDALRRVAREAVEDAAADGCDFLEIRFGPSTHARPGLPDLDAVIAAACEGLDEGRRATGMPVGLVVCLLRHVDDGDEPRGRPGGRSRGGQGRGRARRRRRRARSTRRSRRTPSRTGSPPPPGSGLTAHAAEAGPPAAAVEAATDARRVAHRPRIARRRMTRTRSPGRRSRGSRSRSARPRTS